MTRNTETRKSTIKKILSTGRSWTYIVVLGRNRKSFALSGVEDKLSSFISWSLIQREFNSLFSFLTAFVSHAIDKQVDRGLTIFDVVFSSGPFFWK